jgi:hypothetical protein
VNYVVIDGFTVQGGTTVVANPAGIFFYSPGGLLGPQVLNNVIQDNSVGVWLAGMDGGPYVQGAAIERNLFRNNNPGTGFNHGLGILAYGVEGVVITENEFTGNRAAAMYFDFAQGATITKNTSENDGAFVVIGASTGSQFSHNRGKKFGHAGVLPVNGFTPDAAVDIAPDNSSLEISYNDLEDGKSPISNGIAFTNAFGAGTSHLLDVINNKIERFPGSGIVAEDFPAAGTLYDSSIIGNEVEDNGTYGIYIDGVPGNAGNLLFDNEAKHNGTNDCEDDTGLSVPGPGTLGTYNQWFNNIGKLSSPTGLCTPVTLHDHDERH